VFTTALAVLGTRPWLRPAALLCVPLPVVLALVVCLVSAWSPVPLIALRRLGLTVCIIWSLCIAAQELGYARVLLLLKGVLLAVLVANYVAVLAFPALGMHTTDTDTDLGLVGDWRGVMGHKNVAGVVCAITLLVYGFDFKRRWVVVQVMTMLLAAVFLLFSQSKTSVAIVVLAAIIGILFTRTRFAARLYALPVLAVGGVLGMIWFNIYQYAFVQAVNDPRTFTGRVLIWRALMNFIGDHFWLGTGYGSFWNVGDDGPIYRYASGWVTRISEGHNGYLDMACQLGVPLAALVLVLLLAWPFARLMLSPQSQGPRGGLLLALLVVCAGHNMTESSFLERDSVVEFALMLVIALTWQITAQTRPARARSVEQAGTGARAARPPRADGGAGTGSAHGALIRRLMQRPAAYHYGGLISNMTSSTRHSRAIGSPASDGIC
jgi:O-antigen ligase